VVRHAVFEGFVSAQTKGHPNLEADLSWLIGRLKNAPETMGDHVAGLKTALPVFKGRCKDSCCKIGARSAWRIIYAVNAATLTVTLLILLHKKECENPSGEYLQQHLSRAGFGGS
jgi:hypothetical protein